MKHNKVNTVPEMGCLIGCWMFVLLMLLGLLAWVGAIAGLWGSFGGMVSFFERIPPAILRGDPLAILEGGGLLVFVAIVTIIVWAARRP